MTKVVHCKKEPYDVYIGRPSKWGNPFTHIKINTPLLSFKLKQEKRLLKHIENG